VTRFTSRRTAAGILALGVMLGSLLVNTMSASAATRTAGSAGPARFVAASTAGTNVVRLSHQGKAAAPDIAVASCTSSRATWVHVDSAYGLQCFGGTGTSYFSPYPALYSFCAGNNHGSFEVYNANIGRYVITNYSAGYGSNFGARIYIVWVTINGWSGSYRC
jgi:hypothetical protein